MHAEEPSFWFTDTTWATLAVETAEPNHDRARTALAARGIGGVGAAAGVLSGSAVGATSLVNPYTAAIATGLVVLASACMFVADRLAVMTMDRATADLSERE